MTVITKGGSPLKILHLLSQRPDSTGSGIYLQAMLGEAAASGHRNAVVAGIQSDRPATLDQVDPAHCRFVTFGRGADISFPIVGMSDVMPYDSRRFRDLSETQLDDYETAFAAGIDAAVAAFGPDIIHSHHLWLVSSLARRRLPELPVVATCHGSDLRQFHNCPHLRPRVLEGCRGLDTVMALSRVQKGEIESLYGLPPHRVRVVGAGYNDTLFASRPKPDPDPVQLVYAGKLSNAKGVPWLLRALASLDRPEWRLHLVGSGSGEEQSQCLALARALGKRVRVHGAVSQETLAGIMAESHVFVLPSFFEGLPLVVLEALASGCRVVATDLPGVKELLATIRSDAVSLVPTPPMQSVDQPRPDASGAFETRLTGALESQARAAAATPQFDRKSFRQVLADYTWKGVYQKVDRIYGDVLARQGAITPQGEG